MAKKKIVVAYSGGLDTSVMVKWLNEKYDAEIITLTGDLGQRSELEGLEEKAKKTGAVKSYVPNLQEEFITEYVWKALKAGAVYEGDYPMATAIGRPLLAKKLVEIAHAEGADTVAHGCTGKGNDQVRFEVGVQTLDPKLDILAPLRMWEFKTREEEIDYALANDIPITITKKSPYSIDENIWGVSAECGQLEDTNLAPPEDAYQWTVNPKHAPDFPTIVSIEFEKGIPVKLNGEPTSPVDMVKKLNKLGGENGVGRIDMIENRVVGIKSREIYEAPAAKILLRAHHELEKMVLDRETYRHKQDVANKYGNLIYDGLWFSPLFEALTAFVDETQKRVTGEVQLEIYKGGLTALKRASKYSLYNEALATYGAGDDFNHQHSEGFIRLYGLPYKVVNSVESFNRGE